MPTINVSATSRCRCLIKWMQSAQLDQKAATQPHRGRQAQPSKREWQLRHLLNCPRHSFHSQDCSHASTRWCHDGPRTTRTDQVALRATRSSPWLQHTMEQKIAPLTVLQRHTDEPHSLKFNWQLRVTPPHTTTVGFTNLANLVSSSMPSGATPPIPHQLDRDDERLLALLTCSPPSATERMAALDHGGSSTNRLGLPLWTIPERSPKRKLILRAKLELDLEPKWLETIARTNDTDLRFSSSFF